jgi:hypothetical protein
LLLLFPLLLAAPAHAQQLDLATNYSYLRSYPNGSGTPFDSTGGSVSAAWYLRPWVSVAADFGGYNFHGLATGVSGRLFTYTAGPRFSYPRARHRIDLFAHFLAGGARVNEAIGSQSDGENGFALIAGGGADFRINSFLSLRALQADYLMTRFNRVTDTRGIQNDVRVSAGVTIHFDIGPSGPRRARP